MIWGFIEKLRRDMDSALVLSSSLAAFQQNIAWKQLTVC